MSIINAKFIKLSLYNFIFLNLHLVFGLKKNIYEISLS
ncbi:hypothetical protein MuYL_2825 [Mucilaginibacter xinganensis]|uniref:Uncharacterized protein n=1 Tax=Mucilaginibacter xinganensis TaxID=1234841 RepID=A0A223NXX9_9SPHI|nr:hypothetical protein MuYL_2825 [Mucilaginibacter xinganensis]